MIRQENRESPKPYPERQHDKQRISTKDFQNIQAENYRLRLRSRAHTKNGKCYNLPVE